MLEKLLCTGMAAVTLLTAVPSFAETPRPLPLPSITNINFAPSNPPPYLNPNNEYSSQEPPKKDEPKLAAPQNYQSGTPSSNSPSSIPEQKSSPTPTPSYEPSYEPRSSSRNKGNDVLGYILTGIGAVGAAASLTILVASNQSTPCEEQGLCSNPNKKEDNSVLVGFLLGDALLTGIGIYLLND